MNMLQKLSLHCVDGMRSQDLKGKARDKAALSFMAGAAMALHEANHPEASHMVNCVGLIIAPRGYREIERIANEATKESAQ